jgi:hypothetical protein
MDLSRIIAGLAIAAGLFYVGHAIDGNIKRQQFVEVRGLAERIVKSDKAIWQITFATSAENFADLNRQIVPVQEQVRKFIIEQGFPESAIQKMAPQVNENPRNAGMQRFSARQTMTVETTDIERVSKVSERIEPLLAAGVRVESNMVRYFFTSLNAIKPDMLREAAASAKQAAEGFSRDAHATVGGIKQASQGLFSIGSPLTEYDQESSIMKKVRVVTRMEYYLK